MNCEIGIDACALLCVKQVAGSCCITQGAQLGALRQPRWMGCRGWEGGPRGRGYIYTASSFTLLYSRN